MGHHNLKTLATYFDAIADGRKTFEVRRNDRGFQTGDTIELQRYEETRYGLKEDRATAPICFRISYLFQGGQFGVEPGYCVLGLAEALATLPVSPAKGEGE